MIFVILFLGVFGLFIWNRAEGRSDNRHTEDELRANRELILEVHNQIHAEMKDFHRRLCRIEERNRGFEMGKTGENFRPRDDI